MRVLIVSADMGEGHNATGRALCESVQRCWPDATVRWTDVLDAMGRGVGPALRWTYRANVQRTPWLYEFFFAALWRSRWFSAAAKRFVGAWAGRALRSVVRRVGPDLVLSTYPLGTAGLAWLRAHGDLATPCGAWVSDFAPHPFWVYENVDVTVVMHEAAVALARRCASTADVAVGAAPVTARVAPGDRSGARHRLGLPADDLVALVSCGSLGFGSVCAATVELLRADPRVTVVVICGHNERLRAQVTAAAGERDARRVVALGWTDQMPDLLVACDVLVTNAGGVTSLEALACERPVLMYQPIAAHGRANARLMEQAGLARVCDPPGSLTAAVRELIADPDALRTMERRAREHTEHSTGLDTQLRALYRATA